LEETQAREFLHEARGQLQLIELDHALYLIDDYNVAFGENSIKYTSPRWVQVQATINWLSENGPVLKEAVSVLRKKRDTPIISSES